ncbi:hypothetical protein B0H17DRAFT_1243486, partial [Mycena rosella]
LFQNAADFDIVGGQFVSGDVHNHFNTHGSREQSRLLPVNTTDAPAESEIYCNQLLRQRRGFPLFVPEPQPNLPEEYQRTGISIGDVGRITPEGIFDFFFNIYLPADHPINANVPEDFSPLPLYSAADVLHLKFAPGNHVSTPLFSSIFPLSMSAPHGAVLALPHGAHSEKLENIGSMRQYVGQNAESWYRHVTGSRGRQLSNGSLYLVTGCEKARSWGMASFYNVREEVFQLRFRPTDGPSIAHDYRWRGINARRKSFNASPIDANTLNQTTFIHGLSISLGTGIWGRLFGDVTIREIVDYRLGNTTGDSVSRSQGGSVFSWALGLSGAGSTGGGKQHAYRDEDVFVSDFAPIPQVRYTENLNRS